MRPTHVRFASRTSFQPRGSGQGLLGTRPRIVVLVLAASSAGYVATHLERVPVSNRLRFNNVSRQEELELGEASLRHFLEEYKGRFSRNDDPRLLAIQRISKRLVAAADKVLGEDQEGKTDWRVYLIHVQEPNAFVLPGGKIFVMTGILPLCQNEDGLAAVLGHELAHQRLRHGAEAWSLNTLLVWARFALSTVIDDSVLTALGFKFLLELPHSRQAENEADRVGIMISSTACYDPEEAIHFWERMGKLFARSSGMIAFTSTHPTDADRARRLTALLPEAKRAREASCGDTNNYLGAFKSSGLTPLPAGMNLSPRLSAGRDISQSIGRDGLSRQVGV